MNMKSFTAVMQMVMTEERVGPPVFVYDTFSAEAMGVCDYYYCESTSMHSKTSNLIVIVGLDKPLLNLLQHFKEHLNSIKCSIQQCHTDIILMMR